MRNKVFILFFLGVCSGINSFAQPDDTVAEKSGIPHAGIEAIAGVAFAPRTLFMPTSAAVWMDYVKPGYGITLHANLPLHHGHLGITAQAGCCFNNYNMNKYTAAQQASFAGTSTVTELSYGHFANYMVMAGGFAWLAKGRLTAQVFAMAGADALYLPNMAIQVKIIQPVQSQYTSTFIYAARIGFAGNTGIEAAYTVYKNWCAVLSADCLFARVPYTDTRYDEYVQHIGYTSNYKDMVASVFMISLKAGLRYVF